MYIFSELHVASILRGRLVNGGEHDHRGQSHRPLLLPRRLGGLAARRRRQVGKKVLGTCGKIRGNILPGSRGKQQLF